jgi:hypothetical protein
MFLLVLGEPSYGAAACASEGRQGWETWQWQMSLLKVMSVCKYIFLLSLAMVTCGRRCGGDATRLLILDPQNTEPRLRQIYGSSVPERIVLFLRSTSVFSLITLGYQCQRSAQITKMPPFGKILASRSCCGRSMYILFLRVQTCGTVILKLLKRTCAIVTVTGHFNGVDGPSRSTNS